MRTLYLGNDWDIRRKQIKVRGVLVTVADAVTVHGLLTASLDLDPVTGQPVPIDPSLDLATLTWIADGDAIGTVQGFDLTGHVGPLLDAAEAENQELIIYDRVKAGDQDYFDYEELVVERDRPAGLP